LTLQNGEGSDDLGCLKGSVASTNGDLLEDARFDQPLNRLIGLDEASSHHLRGAVDRDDGRADKNAKE
jgi:D-lyxose ketol-isomerase